MKEKNSVLIIDDEKTNCYTISHILKNEYTVYVATDPMEGIEVAKRTLPDVILLDIIMPEINGYEVISILKNTFETKNIPVIFITGLNSEEDEEMGLSLGAEDYINKPFSPSIVKLRVKKIIQTLNQIEIIKQLCNGDNQAGILCSDDEFYEKINLMWEHSKLTKTTITIMLVVVNNFDSIMEVVRETQSNIALHLITKVIEHSFQYTTGVLHRLGGTKYGIVVLDFDKQKSFDIATNIQINVEKTLETYTRGRVSNIKVCIGVSSYLHTKEDLIDNSQKTSVEDFISIAEQTFLTAKIRNKIVQTYKD